MYVTQRLLCLRRERPRLFVGGAYSPLRGHPHLAAFARAADGQTLIVAAPVQLASLTRGALIPPMGPEVWRDHMLSVPGEPGRHYQDLFTGRGHVASASGGRAALRVAEMLGDFPVAA